MKKRILFVDDIRHVLNSLRLSLRGMNNEWDMVFALGGEEAASLLQRSQFDLLVTDMRMPGIDGAQLLALAHRDHPSMGRVILSGYAEEDCVLKNISLAHQYLSKPCTTQELVATIGNALSQDDALGSTRMKEVVSNLQSLPALPAVYRELAAALENNDTSWKEVCEILSKDMALVATVLRVANCAFFGLGGKVASLDHAVKLLGTQTLRTLVLSTHLFSIFDQKTMPVFSVSRLWNHSIRVAGFARLIATKENLPATSREDCAIAGMLHDIGKVILSVILPDDFRQVIDTVQLENCAVHEAEMRHLGVTHAEIGAYLMGIWGFGHAQREAVRFHHMAVCDYAKPASVQNILHAANILDHELVHINASFKPRKEPCHTEENSDIIINYNSWKSVCEEKTLVDKQDKTKSLLYI